MAEGHLKQLGKYIYEYSMADEVRRMRRELDMLIKCNDKLIQCESCRETYDRLRSKHHRTPCSKCSRITCEDFDRKIPECCCKHNGLLCQLCTQEANDQERCSVCDLPKICGWSSCYMLELKIGILTCGKCYEKDQLKFIESKKRKRGPQ